MAASVDSLRNYSQAKLSLCVLGVSVVTISQQKLTTEAQRTQRLHREEVKF